MGYIVMGLFGFLAYGFGMYRIIRRRYQPNTFSRLVWVGIALNSFLAVLMGGGSSGSHALAGIILLGSLVMAIGSLWCGYRHFGIAEKTSLANLVVAVIIWIITQNPLLSLVMSLAAHFIGGIPTIVRIMRRPRSEPVMFWFLFLISALPALFIDGGTSWREMIVPLYFSFYNAGVVALIMIQLQFFR
jgi:hypothetical protein